MTDQTRTLRLDRFYVALSAPQGQAPSLQVAARTSGVRPEHLAECIRVTQLLPPSPAQRSAQMLSSLGIFRGETLDYIVAIAQSASNGSPQFEYILLPSTVMRSVGGNIRLFEAAASEPFPQFTNQQNSLPALVLDSPAPPDANTQTDDLLALINFCKGDMKV
ncbi:MAG TPA: hypothetical protein VKQ72_23505, partial [Aggregatilineales bacterium]|nr:hypothetical protein [Aggregatilineales bacterium]